MCAFSAEYGGVLAISVKGTFFVNSNTIITVDGVNIFGNDNTNMYNLYPFTTCHENAVLGMQIPFKESIVCYNSSLLVDHTYWLYKYVLVE